VTTPWKLRIDWTCWAQRAHPAYAGARVEVWLHVMGEEPRLLREFPDPPEAAGWCRRFIEGRGHRLRCDPYLAEREGHTHLVIHPGPPLRDS
jgi:hypothetical protein